MILNKKGKTSLTQTFLGIGTVIIAFAYVFARKYKKDEYTRTFLLIVFILFITMFLISLVYR